MGRIHHNRSLGNACYTVINQLIQMVALPHVAEEVFLRPTPEHGRRQFGAQGAVVGGQNGRLVTAFRQLTELPYPEPIAQLGTRLASRIVVGCPDGRRMFVAMNSSRDQPGPGSLW
jgi:hypothetical protein